MLHLITIAADGSANRSHNLRVATIIELVIYQVHLLSLGSVGKHQARVQRQLYLRDEGWVRTWVLGRGGMRGAREGHEKDTRRTREGHERERGTREGHERDTRGTREGHERERGTREGRDTRETRVNLRVRPRYEPAPTETRWVLRSSDLRRRLRNAQRLRIMACGDCY